MGQTLSEPVVDKVRENCLNQVCCLETPLSLSPHNNHPIAIPNSFPISPAISATNSEPFEILLFAIVLLITRVVTGQSADRHPFYPCFFSSPEEFQIRGSSLRGPRPSTMKSLSHSYKPIVFFFLSII